MKSVIFGFAVASQFNSTGDVVVAVDDNNIAYRASVPKVLIYGISDAA